MTELTNIQMYSGRITNCVVNGKKFNEVEWAESITAEMKSWRAKGGKWDQIHADIDAVRKVNNGDYIQVSKGTIQFYKKYPVDVTAWGEAERNQIIHVHRREISGQVLHGVFDEALRSNAVIVWLDDLPDDWITEHEAVTHICGRMVETWGKLPPYIEVVEVIVDGFGEHEHYYSIKPIWDKP